MSHDLLVVARPGCEPRRAHPHDAGLDLVAAEACRIAVPGHTNRISTGVRVAIPPGYVGLVVARSSLYQHGLELANGVGVIDSDYRGEIMLQLRNTKSVPDSDPREAGVEKGQRIAQLLIVPIALPAVALVKRLDTTERGTGGFGSTGA